MASRYAKLKVPELKAFCRSLKLTLKGTKKVLLERLDGATTLSIEELRAVVQNGGATPAMSARRSVGDDDDDGLDFRSGRYILFMEKGVITLGLFKPQASINDRVKVTVCSVRNGNAWPTRRVSLISREDIAHGPFGLDGKTLPAEARILLEGASKLNFREPINSQLSTLDRGTPNPAGTSTLHHRMNGLVQESGSASKLNPAGTDAFNPRKRMNGDTGGEIKLSPRNRKNGRKEHTEDANTRNIRELSKNGVRDDNVLIKGVDAANPRECERQISVCAATSSHAVVKSEVDSASSTASREGNFAVPKIPSNVSVKKEELSMLPPSANPIFGRSPQARRAKRAEPLCITYVLDHRYTKRPEDQYEMSDIGTDSEDENVERPRKVIPEWCKKKDELISGKHPQHSIDTDWIFGNYVVDIRAEDVEYRKKAKYRPSLVHYRTNDSYSRAGGDWRHRLRFKKGNHQLLRPIRPSLSSSEPKFA